MRLSHRMDGPCGTHGIPALIKIQIFILQRTFALTQNSLEFSLINPDWKTTLVLTEKYIKCGQCKIGFVFTYLAISTTSSDTRS